MTPFQSRLRFGMGNHHLRNKLGGNHTCPGWFLHDHPRQGVVFKRYNERGTRMGGHRANRLYAHYWRIHPAEQAAQEGVGNG